MVQLEAGAPSAARARPAERAPWRRAPKHPPSALASEVKEGDAGETVGLHDGGRCEVGGRPGASRGGRLGRRLQPSSCQWPSDRHVVAGFERRVHLCRSASSRWWLLPVAGKVHVLSGCHSVFYELTGECNNADEIRACNDRRAAAVRLDRAPCWRGANPTHSRAYPSRLSRVCARDRAKNETIDERDRVIRLAFFAVCYGIG